VSALRIPIDELRTVKIVNKSEARVALSAADCLFKVSANDLRSAITAVLLAPPNIFMITYSSPDL
jgi:hypothetical protein